MKKRLANKIRNTVSAYINYDSNYQPYSANQQKKSAKVYTSRIPNCPEDFRIWMYENTVEKVSRKEYKETKRIHPMLNALMQIKNEH